MEGQLSGAFHQSCSSKSDLGVNAQHSSHPHHFHLPLISAKGTVASCAHYQTLQFKKTLKIATFLILQLLAHCPGKIVGLEYEATTFPSNSAFKLYVCLGTLITVTTG